MISLVGWRRTNFLFWVVGDGQISFLGGWRRTNFIFGWLATDQFHFWVVGDGQISFVGGWRRTNFIFGWLATDQFHFWVVGDGQLVDGRPSTARGFCTIISKLIYYRRDISPQLFGNDRATRSQPLGDPWIPVSFVFVPPSLGAVLWVVSTAPSNSSSLYVRWESFPKALPFNGLGLLFLSILNQLQSAFFICVFLCGHVSQVTFVLFLRLFFLCGHVSNVAFLLIVFASSS